MKTIILLCILGTAFAVGTVPVEVQTPVQFEAHQEPTQEVTSTGEHYTTFSDKDHVHGSQIVAEINPPKHQVTEEKPVYVPQYVPQYYPYQYYPFYPKPYYPFSVYKQYPHAYPEYPQYPPPEDYSAYYPGFQKGYPFYGHPQYPYYKQFEGPHFFKEPFVHERPYNPNFVPSYNTPYHNYDAEFHRTFPGQYRTPSTPEYQTAFKSPYVTGVEPVPMNHVV